MKLRPRARRHLCLSLLFFFSILLYSHLCSAEGEQLQNSAVESCTGISIGKEDKVQCRTTTLNNLQFCSFMNGEQTDEAFNNVTVIVDGARMTAATWFDNAMQITFNQISTQIQQIQAKRGGTLCSGCLDRLKMLLCANAWPQPGFKDCVVNHVMGGLFQAEKHCSTQICGCREYGLCSLNTTDGSMCSLKTPADARASLCLIPKLADVSSYLSKCSRYLTPIQDCISTMTACGCVRDQHVVAMCQMYFSKEGTRKIVLPKGNCTEQDHKWCDSSSDMFGPKSLLGTPDKQLTCPNGDFCLTNPTPLSIMSVFNKLPTTLAESSNQDYLKMAVCLNEDDPDCPKGCTKPESMTFDPRAKIYDRSCQRDVLVLATWGTRNLPWIITLIIFIPLVLLISITMLLMGACKLLCFTKERSIQSK